MSLLAESSIHELSERSGGEKLIDLISHPNQGIGYKFVEDGKSLVFLTDNELTYKHLGGLEYQDYADFSANAVDEIAGECKIILDGNNEPLECLAVSAGTEIIV